MSDFSTNQIGWAANLLSPRSITATDYIVNSGTGSISNTVNGSDYPLGLSQNYTRVSSTAYKTTDLVFSSPSGVDSFIASAPKNICFSFASMLFTASTPFNPVLRVEVFQDGAAYQTFDVSLKPTGYLYANWVRNAIFFRADMGYSYTFKYTLLHDATAYSNNVAIQLSSFCAQIVNVWGEIPLPYAPPQMYVTGGKALDFASLASHAFQDLDMTVIGADIGDPVQLCTTPDMAATNLDFSAFVSATDTVTIRARNNNSGGSINPPALDFTVVVNKIV